MFKLAPSYLNSCVLFKSTQVKRFQRRRRHSIPFDLYSIFVFLSSHATAWYFFQFLRLPLSLHCLHTDLPGIGLVTVEIVLFSLTFSTQQKGDAFENVPSKGHFTVKKHMKYWQCILMFFLTNRFIKVWSSTELLHGHSAVFINVRIIYLIFE